MYNKTLGSSAAPTAGLHFTTELLEKLKEHNRQVCVFYFDASVYNRILRMIDRGDNDTIIISRLLNDEKEDWFKGLDALVWHYNNIIGKNISLYNINANGTMEDVAGLVMFYINKYIGWD